MASAEATERLLAQASSKLPRAKRFGDGLCLSGGGYRAMLFHAGALARLNEAGLLRGIEVVSSVSGGSIAAGVLAHAWPRLGFDEKGVARRLREEVLEPLLKFSQAFVDGPAVLKGMATPWSTAGREVAKAYARHLFDETRLKDLTDRPLFIFCASNLTTGSLFRMSRAYVADYRIGLARDANWRLADAVACSSAFPPFLSPIRIDLTPHTWAEENLDGSVGPAAPPGRAVLTDGGVYDNHGVEPIMKRCRRVFVSDAGAPWTKSDSGFWTWYSQLKRVTDTIDNQVRSLRRSELIDAFKAASKAKAEGVDIAADKTFTSGCYWSIAPSPGLLSSAPALQDILATCDPKPMEVATVLHFLGERATREAVNWGYHVTDQALRAHIDPDLASGSGSPVGSDDVTATGAAKASRALMRVFGL